MQAERGAQIERELLNMTGRNTPPVLFINGELMGGVNGNNYSLKRIRMTLICRVVQQRQEKSLKEPHYTSQP